MADELSDQAVERVDQVARALSVIVEMEGVDEVTATVQPWPDDPDAEVWKLVAWVCPGCEKVHVDVYQQNPEPMRWSKRAAIAGSS